jgi:hypothetical protein
LFSITSKDVKEMEYGFVKISELASTPVCRASHRIFGGSYSQGVQTSQLGKRRDLFQIVENNDKRAEAHEQFIAPETLKALCIH